jgi:hypothetical protein
MRERIDLKAHWGDRRESLDQCAVRAHRCFAKLAVCDPVFSRWFRGGNSREEALQRPFEPTLEACRKDLDNGRNYTDVPRVLIEELGFSMVKWNGLDDDSAVIAHFSCGSYPSVAALPNPNSCDIELPYAGSAADRLLREHKLRELMAVVVDSWDPDWARVSTYKMHKAVNADEYRGISVGWLTYLSDRYGPLPPLPAEYRVVRVGEKGNLIIVSDIERVTASNPGHVRLIRNLFEILRVAGLESPTPAARAV